MQLQKYSKVIAINLNTQQFIPDVGDSTESKPRVFTVENVSGNEVRLFQVGTYSVPLKFSLSTGLPFLDDHSRSSTLYKYWKNYRITELNYDNPK